MTVRVKVVCNHVSPPSSGTGSLLMFTPVYTGSEENKKFFSATPGGSFSFFSVNQQVTDSFQMGKEYYLDITPAE